jgi:hypothetical protein
MGTTPRGYPYPEGTDLVADGAADMQALAEAIDDDVAALPGSVLTLFDAAGDLLVGTGADAAARLAVGTSGHVLTSTGTGAAWSAPAGPTILAKSADTSRASTTTRTADPHLTIAVAANKIYILEMVVWATGNSVRAGVTGPTGASLIAQSLSAAATASFDIGSTIDMNVNTIGTCLGLLSIGGTAGSFTLSWAQVTSSATASVVKRGSYLMLRDITPA